MSITQPSENNNLGNEDNNVVCQIEEIDDDILSLILSRLSTWNLLVQCRCVSKRWNIIISQPEFLRRLPSKLFPFTLYIETVSRKISIISEHPFFQSQNLPPEFDFITSYNNNHEYDFRFFGSYSDLLIFYYNRGIEIETPYYIICNPITKKHLKLVEEPYLFKGTWNEIVYVKAIGLAGNLEGVSSTSVKGDGHGGFRFVRIGAPEQYYVEGKDTVEVFSSETGKWSRYPNVYRFRFRSENSVTLNNKLHWLGDDGILVIDPFSNDMKQYRIIKNPKYCLCNLGVCQNRLRLAGLSYNSWDNSTILTVWELEDYDDGTWAVVYSKVMNRNLYQPMLRRGINGISFHPCDCDVVFLVNGNRVVRYNLKSRTFKVLLDLTDSWLTLGPLVNPVATP